MLMRHLILITLWTGFLGSAFSQSVKNIIVKQDGQTIRTETYNPIGLLTERYTMIQGSPTMEFLEVFLYQGALKVHSSHYLNGLNMGDYEYSYDEKGNITRIREKLNDSVIGVTYYEYNEHFIVRESKSYSTDGSRTTITYSYNSSDQLAEELIVQMDSNEFMLRNVYIYGKEGLKDRSIVVRNISDTSEIRIFSFDSNQRPDREWILAGNDTLAEIRYFYKTNNKRQLKRWQRNSSGEMVPIAKQRLIKKLYLNSYGEIVRNERFKHNRYASIRKEIYIDYRIFDNIDASRKTVLRYKYKYWKGSRPLIKWQYRT